MTGETDVSGPQTHLAEVVRLSVHGAGLLLRNEVASLDGALQQALEPFVTSHLPMGASPAEGCVRPYDSAEVNRCLSSNAISVSTDGGLSEVYGDGERFWLIDDRWGIAEMNLLKGTWRSWILPEPMLDATAVAEMAVLWPMAQVLRSRGIHLMPAASVVRDGWGMLLIAPFSLEPELNALLSAGFKVIGQRWTVLREEDGRIGMLHMPSPLQRNQSPRLASAVSAPAWVDLASERCGAMQNHGFCDTVLLIESGRRPLCYVRPIGPAVAVPALRRSWPIVELHPARRQGRMPARLAALCRVFDARLARDPGQLLANVDSLRYARRPDGSSRIGVPPTIPIATAEFEADESPAPLKMPQGGVEANPPANLTPWSLAG